MKIVAVLIALLSFLTTALAGYRTTTSKDCDDLWHLCDDHDDHFDDAVGAINTGLAIVIGVLVTGVVSFVVVLVLCCCCPGCPLHSRRHRGAVLATAPTQTAGTTPVTVIPAQGNRNYPVMVYSQGQPPPPPYSSYAIPQYYQPPPQQPQATAPAQDIYSNYYSTPAEYQQPPGFQQHGK